MFNFLGPTSKRDIGRTIPQPPMAGSQRPLMLFTIAITINMVVLLLTACQPQAAHPTAARPVTLPATTAAPITATVATSVHLPIITHTMTTTMTNSEVTVGMTNVQPNGNRVIPGVGGLPALTPLDIPLAGAPVWVVAAPTATSVLWAVTLADGAVQAFEVVDGVTTSVAITPTQLPAGMPPLLTVGNDVARLVAPANASPLTAPALYGDDGLAFIDTAGSLVLEQSGETVTLAVDALPDARILVDEQDRLLLLTAPTDRYGHGVLGDGLEAGEITLVETAPQPRIAQTITVPAPRVVEGIAPMWADLNGDGVREIIVTLSDAEEGAQIVVYGEDGQQVAAGPAIGRAFRWRHQLAVAPFGPDGELMLTDVLTPHLGGVVEFYHWVGDELVIEAAQPGYTSHVIGTRNLDMAVGGDFDGDGKIEVLLPDQARSQLGAVRYEVEGAAVAWTLPANGQIVTNVAAATTNSGGIAVGVGRADDVLRIWQP